MKKKWVITGLILCVVIMFAACGNKIDPTVVDGSDILEDADDLSNNDSISSNADDSQLYDWRDGLKEAIGVEVKVMLDEYDIQKATIKSGESAGVMLSGIFVETQEWNIKIENPEIAELVAQGTEKDVVGERQGFDFFAFKGLKEGSTTVTITDVMKDTKEAGMAYAFIINVTE